MRYMFKERAGDAFAQLCLRNLRRAIARAEAAENPNAIYLRSLETLAQAYRDGKKR